MDWLTDLLTDTKLPVGQTARRAFDWLKLHGAPLFDAVAAVLDRLIAAIETVLELPHPLVFTALAVALAWVLRRSWRTCLWVAVGFLFILNQGYWDETMQSLTLVLAAGVVCMAVGVPIGIALAHRPRLYRYVQPLLDLMQTLPTFVYLIPAAMFFGLGAVPGTDDHVQRRRSRPGIDQASTRRERHRPVGDRTNRRSQRHHTFGESEATARQRCEDVRTFGPARVVDLQGVPPWHWSTRVHVSLWSQRSLSPSVSPPAVRTASRRAPAAQRSR